VALGLSRLHFPVTTLGPGRRVGIWVQGCSIRCPGCISADTWRAADAGLEVNQIVERISPWLDACDGVTVSGGEPFDQPGGLALLLRAIHQHRDTNVLVYTGHPVERIEQHLRAMAPMIDALVSDPFDIAQPQTKALRGSDNQRLHFLTERGRALFSPYERALTVDDRQLHVMLDAQGTAWIAGIPARGDLARLQAILQAQGHTSFTSEAPTNP
jgi:anaerobic ribonucleoside-triphosphate reductase activating protein